MVHLCELMRMMNREIMLFSLLNLPSLPIQILVWRTSCLKSRQRTYTSKRYHAHSTNFSSFFHAYIFFIISSFYLKYDCELGDDKVHCARLRRCPDLFKSVFFPCIFVDFNRTTYRILY